MLFSTTALTNAKLAILLSILLVALVIRLYFLANFTYAINTEGAEYTRIAQNLVAGNGYVGIATEGNELMFPPLYPLLIAATSYIVGDFYHSAQCVSFFAGLILLLSVFGVARDLYGDKIGYLAVSIAALHPILVMLSTTTWIEGLYLSLMTAGIYFTNRCHYEGKWHQWGLAGGFLGLAYLCCPQAIVFPFFFVFALLLLGRSKKHMHLGKAALFMGVFALIALPYIVYLTTVTGTFHIEGKTIINNELGKQHLDGISENISGYLVAENLEEKGVWLRPQSELAKSSTSVGYRTTLKIMFSKGLKNLQAVIENISSKPFLGGPLILPLVIIGLFRSNWDSNRASGELMLLLTAAGSLAAMTTIIYMFEVRYHYILIPFMVIWAACGIKELKNWAQETLTNLQLQALPPVIGGRFVEGLTACLLAGIFMAGGKITTKNFMLDPMSSIRRTAGEWLATTPGNKAIMDLDTVATFHAGAKYIPMPYCDSQTALKYIEKKEVDFIVLKSGDIERGHERPYLQEWLNNGIPSPSITLTNQFNVDENKRLLIYKVSKPN